MPMNETDDARLVEIRARADAATPGPWKLWAMSVLADPVGNSDYDDAQLIATTYDPTRGLRTFNATFIAAARSDVPWLLDRLAAESARADVAEARHATMRTALSFLHAWPDGVTGKRMVDAEDIVTLLDVDRAALSPAETEAK